VKALSSGRVLGHSALPFSSSRIIAGVVRVGPPGPTVIVVSTPTDATSQGVLSLCPVLPRRALLVERERYGIRIVAAALIERRHLSTAEAKERMSAGGKKAGRGRSKEKGKGNSPYPVGQARDQGRHHRWRRSDDDQPGKPPARRHRFATCRARL